jgi:hypothetical protein
LCDIQIQLCGQIEGNRQASAPESSRTTDPVGGGDSGR